MGATAATPANIVIGAPGVLLLGGTDVGATIGPVTYTVTQKLYQPKINGIPGTLAGTDFVQEEMGQMEVSAPEQSAAVLGAQVPGSGSVTALNTVMGTPVFTATTMAAAAVAGQRLALKLTSVTSLAVGMVLSFAGSAPALQYRTVTRVGTLGSGGTGIDINDPLSAGVANGAAVVQVNGDGGTTFSSGIMTNRRLASSAGQTVEARLWGLNGLRYAYGLKLAINLGPAAFALSDTAEVAPKLKFESRIDPANLTTSPWYITSIPADA